MSKNKKVKVQVKPQENVEVKEETNETNENIKVENNEGKEKIKRLVTEINDFVNDYAKYHDILPLEPIKQNLANLQKRKDLEYEDKLFLTRINRAIYTKTLKRGERFSDYEGQFVFRTMDDKINRLSELANGYGDHSLITTINDLQEDAFYCIREKEENGKMIVEEGIKITNVGGAYLTETMEENESIDVKNKFVELEQNQDNSNKKIFISTKEFTNEAKHAERYFAKICNDKKAQAEDKNKKLDEIEEQDEVAVGV